MKFVRILEMVPNKREDEEKNFSFKLLVRFCGPFVSFASNVNYRFSQLHNRFLNC